MKHLYLLQTLLVLLFSSLTLPRTYGQFGEPLHVNVLNTGSSFSDQFAASTGYAWQIIQSVSPQLGVADCVQGSGTNTLKVTFTPNIGATGTTDFIVSYYTLTAPMHPVTRWYRFNVSSGLVLTSHDKFVVDSAAVNVPLDVLANDSTTSIGSPLFITTVSVSTAGSATVDSTGTSILFTPDTAFAGDTWLQYIACDSSGNCGEGNVHVLVRDPDQQDSIVYTKFLLNTKSLEILTPFEDFEVGIEPLHGNIASDGADAWIYTPDEDYVGTDTLQLHLLNLVYRTYALTVYDKPVNVHARNDKFYVRPGLSVTFNVLNNDLIEYDVSSHTNPAKGVLLDLGGGTYTYTPISTFKGVDKFTYTTCFDDTVYCETATVFLHVTNLEPDNQFSYKLQTSKDLALAIDYPIEYTDFSYIISADPEHGELIFYNGLQTINFDCDTIDAYNMLVYEPDAGFTGEDQFEYYYCVVPSNQCFLVTVDINVVDPPSPETCPCILDCVWPGDANTDGRVDMSDLLTLGNHIGDVGTPRSYSNPENWFGQHANEWQENGQGGIQYSDSDGDGTLSEDDVNWIDEYYYRTNDVVAKDVQQKLPYQFSIIPIQYSLDSGDLVILDIALGNANNPVIDIKGVKFSLNIPPYMMDSASVTLDFHQDSWLAEGSPFISLGKVPWNGRIDGGFSRVQGYGATGHGVIATTTFIIVDDVEGFKTNNDGIIQIPVTLQSGVIMDGSGTMYDVEGSEITLTYDLGAPKNNEYELIVYPNPANDLVNIHLNGKTTIETIHIVDPQGRVIRSFSEIDQKHFLMDVSQLSTGIYYVQVKHTEGIVTKALSVIR